MHFKEIGVNGTEDFLKLLTDSPMRTMLSYNSFYGNAFMLTKFAKNFTDDHGDHSLKVYHWSLSNVRLPGVTLVSFNITKENTVFIGSYQKTSSSPLYFNFSSEKNREILKYIMYGNLDTHVGNLITDNITIVEFQVCYIITLSPKH